MADWDWVDDTFDWLMENGETIVKAGMAVVDYVNKDETVNQLYDASTSNIIAPFDPAHRDTMGDRYMALQEDPSYIANLPGYQFGLDQLTKQTNREAARTGHYLGNRRIGLLQDETQKYAEKAYQAEVDNLGLGAGIDMQPSASAYADMTIAANKADVGLSTGAVDVLTNKGDTGLFDIGKDLLSNFSDAVGGSEFFDGISESLGIDFGAWGDDAKAWMSETFGIDVSALGDSFTDFASEYGLDEINWGSAASRLLSGEDPKEVLKDTAMEYVKEQGKDMVKDKLLEVYDNWTGDTGESSSLLDSGGSDAGADSGYGDQAGPDNTLSLDTGGDSLYNINSADLANFSGFTGSDGTTNFLSGGDAGADSLYGDMPGPSTGTASGVSGWGAGGGAALGGIGLSYLASEYIDDNPALEIGAGLVGSYVGAGVGSAATGGTFLGGMSGPAAAAGPYVALAATIYMIGSGIYGMVQGRKARNEADNVAARNFSQFWETATANGTRVDDPTGGGLGMGYDTTFDGHRFFVPEDYYKMTLDKHNYGTDTNYRNHSTMQGNYGSYYNPGEDQWYEGSFGGQHASSQMGAGSWQSMGQLETAHFENVDHDANDWHMNPNTGLYEAGWGNKHDFSYADKQGAWTDSLNQAIQHDAWRGELSSAINYAAMQGEGGSTVDWGAMSTGAANLAGYTGSKVEQNIGEGDTQQVWERTQTYTDKQANLSCFIAGTLVRMADGSTKPIETIRTGELILASPSTDHSAKTMAPAAVVEVEVVELGDRKLFSFNGSKPFITHDHLVMTTNGWKVGSPEAHMLEYRGNLARNPDWASISSQQHYDYEVLALAEGDMLKTEDGPIKLDSLVESGAPPETLVYNLRFDTNFDKLFVGSAARMYLVQD